MGAEQNTAHGEPMPDFLSEALTGPDLEVVARIIDPVSFEKVRQHQEPGGPEVPSDAAWRCNRARDKARFIDALYRGCCVKHVDRPVRTVLDGDLLCQECCDQWARNEGLAARELRKAGGGGVSFQLDTSGRIRALVNAPHAANWYCWDDLDAFTRGYVEALLGDPDCHLAAVFGRSLAFRDLAPETLVRIIEVCAGRVADYANRLREYGPAAQHAIGRQYWEHCQAGVYPDATPTTAILSDDGLINLIERVAQ